MPCYINTYARRLRRGSYTSVSSLGGRQKYSAFSLRLLAHFQLHFVDKKMLSSGLCCVCMWITCVEKKGRSALDTANKGAEVVVHLSIKGKGSSQSEHLHLSVYVQEDPSAICIMPMARMPDAQVHFFFFYHLLSPTRKLVAARALRRYLHYHVPFQCISNMTTTTLRNQLHKHSIQQ